MRAIHFKASCFLLAVFFGSSNGKVAYCQQFSTISTLLRPAFIKGLEMDQRSQSTSISNVVANAEPGGAVADKNKIRAEELINYILRKNAPEHKAAAPITGDTAITETRQLPMPVAEAKQGTAAQKNAGEETAAMAEDEIDPLISKYAEMISVEPQDISNYPLYRFIDKWYGTPYKWGGMDADGIDCSAFSQRLYRDIYGVGIVRTAREQRHSADLVKHYTEANEGDLIFFRIRRLRVSHVGVYLANGYFVHASRSRGVMISSMNDRYWSRRYAGCGRIERDERGATESDFTE